MDAAIKAVSEGDPKTGKARVQSAVRYPYFDLENCVGVARVIHERAGGACDHAQLAALLGYSGVSNGAFRMRVSAAKLFGLIEGKDKTGLSVTKRGQAIVAKVSDAAEASARLAAFMSVGLYRDVYKKFEGSSLPGEAGLRNLVENEFGIVKERVASAVRVMMDSAHQSGLFRAAGRTRMVKPPGVSQEGAETAVAESAIVENEKGAATVTTGAEQKTGGGGGGGGGYDDIDPALVGLLQRLPPAGAPLPPKRRKALIDAFTHTINFIYPEAEE